MDPQTSHHPDRFPTLAGDESAGSGFPGVPEVYTTAPLTPAPEPRQAHQVDSGTEYEAPQIEVDVTPEITERFEPVPELAADPVDDHSHFGVGAELSDTHATGAQGGAEQAGPSGETPGAGDSGGDGHGGELLGARAAATSAAAPDADDDDNALPVGLTLPSGQVRGAQTDLDAAIQLGLLTEEQVADARRASAEEGRLPEAVLLDRDALSPEALARCASERHNLPLVDLSLFKIDFTAANLIDPAAAKRYEALPIQMDGERAVTVAMVDPTNIIVIDDISLMTGLDVRPVVASREDIGTAISRLTRLDEVLADNTTDGEDELDLDGGVVDLRGGTDDAPVIKLVNQIVAQAVERGASDIHLQAGEHEMRVRYRVDGVLIDAAVVPRRMAAGVVSRVKIMATLDIAERRIPQDGRISLTIDGHKLDLRVVTLPSVHGEAVIMRILDTSNVVMDLDVLGMRDQERQRFEKGFHQAYGAVLVTGPTGSGKSTTLYAALGAINSPEKNIITIEDPVEYQLEGVNQVQVNPKAGLTFANGLRALMRADPDVIMIGEIRDGETAKIAIESALTGHLVLSTLHTNDAPSAVSRLLEMGVESFLIASSIETVVAQRLTRKLCTRCKEPIELSVERLRVNGYERDTPLQGFTAKGCSRCSHTGYKGRLGIYEVLENNDEIRDLITARATADDIGDAARRAGMRTLREDGLAKVEQGLTSVEEIARVCGV